MRQEKVLSFDNIIALLMPALLMAMTITHNIVFLYIVFAIGVVRINKPFVIFPVYFVASLSTGWFAVAEGLSAGRYLSILMIISLFVDFLSNKKYGNLIMTMPIVAFLFYCFLSAVLSVTGSFDAFFMMFQSLMVLLFFIMRNNEDVHSFFDIMLYTALIVVVGVSIRTFSEGISALVSTRYGNDLAEGVNPNRIAMMMAQICAIFGVNILNYGMKPRGIISIAGMLLSAFIVVLTGSRTALIAIIVPFILMLLISRKKVGRYISPLILLSIFIYIGFDWMASQDFAGFTRMSLQDLVDTGGTDRINAIKIMWRDVFPQYPLFGVGLGGANFTAIAFRYGMDHPCHNIFFDSLCQLGIFGFVLFFVIVFRTYKDTFKSVNNYENNLISILGLSLLFAATANGIGETVYMEKLFWNAITVCVIGNGIAQSFRESLTDGQI